MEIIQMILEGNHLGFNSRRVMHSRYNPAAFLFG